MFLDQLLLLNTCVWKCGKGLNSIQVSAPCPTVPSGLLTAL